jgi:fucose permease
MFVFGIVIALVGALVPSLSARLGLTLGDVGTLFLAMNFAVLVASITIGLVVDRFGLKPPMAIGPGLVRRRRVPRLRRRPGERRLQHPGRRPAR